MEHGKIIVILGGGTAGTALAHKLAQRTPLQNWKIVVVDKDNHHIYQPGYLFLAFNRMSRKKILRSRRKLLPKGVDYLQREVELIDWKNNRLIFGNNNHKELNYDVLVIATGSTIAPQETLGMQTKLWGSKVFDFYTLEGATALNKKLQKFKKGKLLVHINEMPIKCPVAPLEFAFLADDFFCQKKLRGDIELQFVTPLDGAFTRPKAAKILGGLLEKKNITIISDFFTEKIDVSSQKLVSYDGRELLFDLLVTVPTNTGSELIINSGLGDELGFIPTHRHSLLAKGHQNILVIGDASDIPISKAGSAAHFQIATVGTNVERILKGEKPQNNYDGHVNCFIETGRGKSIMIDFNYDSEPTEGYLTVLGLWRLPLLKESRLNHLAKLLFRHVYWQILMKGRSVPGLSDKMSLKGKHE